MAITNAQQVQQLQLVKKRKDGKRPGYYGPDAGHENDPGHGSNQGGDDKSYQTNRERGIQQAYEVLVQQQLKKDKDKMN